MANVENPYETNLSNNLVVTSYVDESTVKSDYKIKFYINAAQSGPIDENLEIPFKTYSDFYKYSPDEQTVALTSGNPDPITYQGMVEINDNTQEYYVGEFFGIKIIRNSDNTEVDPSTFTVTKIGSFTQDANVTEYNLNNQDGWNLYAENLAETSPDQSERITGIPVQTNNDFELFSWILLFTIGYINNDNYRSLYIPISISSEFLDTSSNKPEGWTTVYSTAVFDEIHNLYISKDMANAYNVVRTANDAVDIATKQLLDYGNQFSTENYESFDFDHAMSLIQNINTAYLSLEKYTDDTFTSVLGSTGLHIRQNKNDPNTSFKMSVFDNGVLNNGPSILLDDTNNEYELGGSLSYSGGSIYQVTSPEFTVPGLNFIIENYESYCFADNSMVSTDRGLVDMKDLTLDHNVKCWDFDNGCITYAKPLFIQTHGKVSRSFEAVFDDGTICKYSKPHRCYCVDTRLFESLSYARNIGKSFYFEDGSIKKLVEWRVVDEPTTVYTMLTDHYMTSFVDGILAGSNMVMIYFIDKDMKYYKKPERKGNRPNNFGIPDKIFRGLRLYESPIPKGIIMRWLKREFISF